MSWSPNDLVTDADLAAYERRILTQFNVTDWQALRQKALEDWLFPLMESAGFNPQRFRTRFIPKAVQSYTSSAFTDRTSAAQDADGINLATVLAASTDYLYIGHDAPFRGVSVRMLEAVNSASVTATWETWADAWEPVTATVVDQTVVGTKPFARGGAVTWTVPEGLVARSVNSVGPYYWARVKVSATPTGAAIGPLLVIRRSRLAAAVTFRTLALIFREAPIAQDGPWTDRAVWYEQEAERSWLRVADQIGGEFDTDADDAVSSTEAGQTAAEVNSGGWRFERG